MSLFLGDSEMSALYQMRYRGSANAGQGAIYIGRGKIVGVDLTGARYLGDYHEHDGQIVGQIILTSSGGRLVTGQAAPEGTPVTIDFSLPPSFGDGEFQSITVGGATVQVAFHKIGDIP